MSLGKVLRNVYDQTSSSSSSLGKFARWAFPFNSQYWIRDAWRKYGKNLFDSSPTSATSLYGGSGIYGPTGSIVGKY